MYKLKCKWCMHEWKYNGDAIYNTQCPKCHKTLKLSKFEEVRE